MNPLKRLLAAVAIGGAGLAAGGCALLGVPPINGAPPPGTSGLTLASPVASPITGNGRTDNPYIGPCDKPQDVDCMVVFDPRHLNPSQSEATRAYKCPTDHPFLLFHDYSPAGSRWVVGEEFRRNENAVNIFTESTLSVFGLAAGTRGPIGTGPGLGGGSATNWDPFHGNDYQAILHCTSDRSHGYSG